MSGFDPGDGWQSVDITEPNHAVYELAQYGPDGELVAGWIRNEPALVLPTIEHTVIEVEWRAVPQHPKTFIRRPAGWYPLGLDWATMPPYDLRWIARFEVLAEPAPRVALYEEQQRTARDLLNDIAGEPWAREVDLGKWRRKYGVDT